MCNAISFESAALLLLMFARVQEAEELLENDAFLKGPDGSVFTNVKFHKLLSALSLVNTEISAPQLAFVVFRVVGETSRHISGKEIPESCSFHPTDVDKQGLYNAALRFTRKHPGKHWAMHEPVSGQAPVSTCISIAAGEKV